MLGTALLAVAVVFAAFSSMTAREQTFERRLDDLREEARSRGVVSGNGTHAVGGPVPVAVRTPSGAPEPGYYGLPILKQPVWEWMIPLYFFVGGLAGMAGLIAAVALIKGLFELARAAMWAAGIGAIISPVLLILDLGRPRALHQHAPRLQAAIAHVVGFLDPVRLWRGRPPLPGPSGMAMANLGRSEPQRRCSSAHRAHGCRGGVGGDLPRDLHGHVVAVTAVPAWNTHRSVLPFHFGMAGLGSAAAVLEFAGFRFLSLHWIGLVAAAAETLVMLWLELRKHGPVDRALHEGKSGWLLRAGESLEGPLALILRCLGLRLPAAAVFTLGALVTRFGWSTPAAAPPATPRPCWPPSAPGRLRRRSIATEHEQAPALAPNPANAFHRRQCEPAGGARRAPGRLRLSRPHRFAGVGRHI